MKKIAILQSNYIPWKGYFDMINMVDTFVIYDEVQYTKNDWRNRNIIKTKQGLQWLTIPCMQYSIDQTIDQTQINLTNWNKKHWQTIKTVYGKAPFFNQYKALFEELYLSCNSNALSEINYQFIKAITELLDINTKIIYSKDLNVTGEKSERLVKICQKLNTDIYLSGPAAKNYLNESLFSEKNIKVEWMDYSDYKAYSQMHPPFEHGVSILDLIFNTGAESFKYLKSFYHEETIPVHSDSCI
ncbi:MAG: WbqC family protein [Marinilabiliaceae bacterium]|nr:WbqC family protein [Marinilabiliaceae bacterium]